MCWWSTRPRAQQERDRDRAADQAELRDPGGGRQRGHRRGDPRPDRRGGRRREGRDRAGIDLYDACRLGRGGAADHGDLPGGQGGGRPGADHRRRRHPLLGRHHQGPGRRGARRDDRRAVRRARREPRRDDHLPRPQLQDLSRHGLAGRHGQGLARAISPGARRRGSPARTARPPPPRSSCPRASRAASRTRDPWPTSSSSSSAASAPGWVIPGPAPSRSSAPGPASSRSPVPPSRRATPTIS